ncbi:hypothetical protein OA258_03165 [Pelagibacteraceae bacterium]|nr:hypothetical protein [Pelagibacteraceae bacterium]
MEKIKSIIIEKLQKYEKVRIQNIDTIAGFVDETGLFENKNIFLVNGYKGIDEESLNNIRASQSNFIFLQENAQRIKKIKSLFNVDIDSYLIDCYELDKESKIKILDNFLNKNKLKISQEVFWFLIDKLDSKYIFFENNLLKIIELDIKDVTLDNVKKILTIDDSNKEKMFFNLLKRNKEIISLYRDKIITNSDVSDLYYSIKYYCQLILDCESEAQYNKKIPVYLFKEKNYLMNVYRKYNPKKKKLLLNLLSSTEGILRKEGSMSIALGLRFLLNIKKITIS